MTTVAARLPRSIPTVQANPALLREGDMVYPDVNMTGNPHRIVAPPEKVKGGWQIDLGDGSVLLVPNGGKVRTQRRPNHQLLDPDVADRLAENYQEARYG